MEAVSKVGRIKASSEGRVIGEKETWVVCAVAADVFLNATGDKE